MRASPQPISNACARTTGERRWGVVATLAAWLLGAAPVAAEPRPSEPEPTRSASDDEGEGEDAAVVDVHAPRSDRGGTPGRASSKVDRMELDEELPRSAPDALRYEPGVFVQQTAHGQASPYIRGRTGQQTLLLFDGVRLNNSTFRQGPNQYFFTVDAQTVHSLEVTRGGASTRYGTDAIGGVIEAHPMEPRTELGRGFRVRPRALLRFGSADEELGFYSQLDTQIDDALRFRVGAGARNVGRLESGGPVLGPGDGRPAEVPAFDDDGRTQLGTGFREMTGDGRVVYGLGPGRRLVAATYLYRQFDAPRTDKCPPPFAPISECLTYEEQFRTLAYLAYQGDLGAAGRRARITLSYQRQHERRRYDRPAAFVVNGGRDDVDTFGLAATSTLAPIHLGPKVPVTLTYGGDVYVDHVDSTAWTEFTDIDVLTFQSRGQYLASSTYVHGGLFVDGEVGLGEHVFLRAGSRVGGVRADAPRDPETDSVAVGRSWPALVGRAGVEVRPIPELSFLGHVDRSFRAPNLDDLTARQQTGPGFQFENAGLEPERALSLELGARVTTPHVEADVWAFRSHVQGAIARALRDEGDCPAGLSQCLASWTRLQLVNLPGVAIIQGLEGSARARLPFGFSLRATVALTHGEGPNPEPRPPNAATPYEQDVPLSRIPPLNGSVAARWHGDLGLYLGAALRWATLQDRLAPSDLGDARIPAGGTPGFAVVDLRAGYRLSDKLLVALVVENVGDSAYRQHGSSLNGAGRGLRAQLQGGF